MGSWGGSGNTNQGNKQRWTEFKSPCCSQMESTLLPTLLEATHLLRHCSSRYACHLCTWSFGHLSAYCDRTSFSLSLGYTGPISVLCAWSPPLPPWKWKTAVNFLSRVTFRDAPRSILLKLEIGKHLNFFCSKILFFSFEVNFQMHQTIYAQTEVWKCM